MKYLIALAFADLHYHNWKDHETYTGRINIPDKALRILAKRACQEDVPLLFSGDLFHNPGSLPNEVMEKFMTTFTAFIEIPKVQFFCIDGNHDQAGRSIRDKKNTNYLSALAQAFSCLKIVNNKSYPITSKISVSGIPYYYYEKDFIRAVKESEPSDILLVHQDLPGAKTPYGFEIEKSAKYGKSIDKFFSKHKLVLSGHIHMPQKLGKKVYMLGAPYHQDISNIGIKMGYWEVYDDFSVEFVRLKLPQFRYYNEGDEIVKQKHIYIRKSSKKTSQLIDNKELIDNNKLDKLDLIHRYMEIYNIDSKSTKGKKLMELLIKNMA